ncbi:MAG: glycosyltransferase [Spirochaetaceae bacterium]|nr:glycosyltransferase [Spirochaetaceae bacterium]
MFLAKLIFYILYFYSIVFIISHIFIITGIIISFKREKAADASASEKAYGSNIKAHPLKVSVIIPARDEAETLPALLESLACQSCSIYEIVLINDRSRDNTLEVMKKYQEKSQGLIKIIDNKNISDGKNPKQAALALAEDVAIGDIFLYTDADCHVPKDWVLNMLKPFGDDKVGLVFGTVTVNKGKTLLEKFQQYDHLLRYHYTVACAGLNIPTGGFGNNLAVRRTALLEAGGFKELEYSVTEDAQLIAKIRNSGKWKIVAQTSLKSMVNTTPVKSWKELYDQELRWSTGAMHAPDIAAKAGYGYIMYQLLTGVAVFIPAFFYPQLFLIFFTGIVSMLSVSITYGIHLKLEKSFWLTLPLSLFIAQFLFPVVTLIATFKPGIYWKGDKL